MKGLLTHLYAFCYQTADLSDSEVTVKVTLSRIWRSLRSRNRNVCCASPVV